MTSSRIPFVYYRIKCLMRSRIVTFVTAYCYSFLLRRSKIKKRERCTVPTEMYREMKWKRGSYNKSVPTTVPFHIPPSSFLKKLCTAVSFPHRRRREMKGSSTGADVVYCCRPILQLMNSREPNSWCVLYSKISYQSLMHCIAMQCNAMQYAPLTLSLSHCCCALCV